MNIDDIPVAPNDTDPSRQHPPTGKHRPDEVKARRLARLDQGDRLVPRRRLAGRRLHEAEQAALHSDLARRGGGEYRQEHRQPFSRLRAETYFLLGAMRQQLQAMDRFRDKKKMPSFQHCKVLIAVRNAAGHWDGKAPDELAAHTPASWDNYTFGGDGTVIAEVTGVDELAAWAREVQGHLLQVERDWR